MINEYIYLLIIQLILTFLIYKISIKLNLLDYPSKRKIHKLPTPYTGGLTLGLTYLIIVFFYDFNSQLNNILIGAFLISITCIFDDKYDVSVGIKLILQIIPIYYLIDQNFILNDLGIYNEVKINLGSFAPIFTLLSLLLIINANNYNDGIDGLCGLIFISIFFLFIYYLYFFKNYTEFLNLITFIIPVFFFLIFNFGFFKIKLFLGDSGSNMLGLIIGYISIYLYTNNSIHPSIICWPLAYTVYEFISINIVRLYKNKNIFAAGSDHFHYELCLIFNNNILLVNLIIVLINLFFGIIGLLIYFNFGEVYSLLFFVLFFILYFFIRLNIKKVIFSN